MGMGMGVARLAKFLSRRRRRRRRLRVTED